MASILVIEDEMNIRMFIAANLEARGYTVEEGESGAAGIAALHRMLPDMVILDMRLGDMTGWDVLEHMQGEPSLAAIPVVLMTASVVDANRDNSNYPNVVQRIVKPAAVAHILDVVRLTIG